MGLARFCVGFKRRYRSGEMDVEFETEVKGHDSVVKR